MAVTPETGRWDRLFAARTRADVGDGIAFVLGFLGRDDLISFAGGLPDPLTFPRERASALLAADAGDEKSVCARPPVQRQFAPNAGRAALHAPRLKRYRALYGADFQMAGLLHGFILRSPHAHARIHRIDTSKAAAFFRAPTVAAAARALEQVKNDVAYSDNPVKLIGISAGVSYGALGSTHHSLHDLAALRAINNIDILVPADDQETHAAVDAAIDSKRPAYLRFGKVPLYALGGAPYETGRARLVRDGVDLAFVANGETVIHALLAAAELAATEGLSCRVLSMHTIRPIDEAAILRAAAECGAIITVEEHMAHGGLGEACAAILMQSGSAIKFKIVAIPDEATITGSQADIFHHYGISMEGLALTAKRLLHGGPASRDP
jgi:transketolase